MNRPTLSSHCLLMAALLLVPALVAVAGLQGCHSPAAADPKTLELDSDANGKVIIVGAAVETISIKLRENASTGYHWVLAPLVGNSARSLGDLRPGNDPDRDHLPGSSSTCYADFRIVGSGQTRITYEYRRPWIKDQLSAETFSVTLDVRDRPPATTPAAPATMSGVAGR